MMNMNSIIDISGDAEGAARMQDEANRPHRPEFAGTMNATSIPSNMIIEPSRNLDVSDSADVVVAGAGIAGVAAALAAARAGASVLLLEDSFSPGGLATVGIVPEYLPIDDGCGRKVMGGITEELLHLSTANLPRELPEACFRRAPAVWLDTDATEEQRRGIRFKTAYNPATYVLDLEALLVAVWKSAEA